MNYIISRIIDTQAASVLHYGYQVIYVHSYVTRHEKPDLCVHKIIHLYISYCMYVSPLLILCHKPHEIAYVAIISCSV